MPEDIHPLMLEKEHMKTNRNQFIPYDSEDIERQSQLYDTLKDTFDEVFEWMASQVS